VAIIGIAPWRPSPLSQDETRFISPEMDGVDISMRIPGELWAELNEARQR
jgi:hypothetical protein